MLRILPCLAMLLTFAVAGQTTQPSTLPTTQPSDPTSKKVVYVIKAEDILWGLFERAKLSVVGELDALEGKDRFNVIVTTKKSFKTFRADTVPASEQSRKGALEFLDKTAVAHESDYLGALQKAKTSGPSEIVYVVGYTLYYEREMFDLRKFLKTIGPVKSFRIEVWTGGEHEKELKEAKEILEKEGVTVNLHIVKRY